MKKNKETIEVEKNSLNKYTQIMQELTDILNVDPAIVPGDYEKPEEFFEEVKNIFASDPDVIKPEDEISEELAIFLHSQKIDYKHSSCPNYGSKNNKKQKEKKTSKEEVIEPEVEETEKIEEEQEEVTEKNEEQKEQKKIEKEADEFFDKKKINTKKVQSNKKEKKIKKERFIRADAFAEVIKKGGTRDELIVAANNLYIEKGGAGSISNATVYHNYAISILEAMGMIVLDSKTKKYQLI